MSLECVLFLKLGRKNALLAHFFLKEHWGDCPQGGVRAGDDRNGLDEGSERLWKTFECELE
jgi:hypothetical protein